MNYDNATLYILMRLDLASMNPGKACAQAAHAANQFIHDINMKREQHGDFDMSDAVYAWENQTDQGFGTTIVLAVNQRQMGDVIDWAENFGILSGITHDPTYPIRDGEVTHLIPLDTCAYVFVPNRNHEFFRYNDNPFHALSLMD